MKGLWMHAPVERTELGYTLKSLDRLWAVVTVETYFSPEEYGYYGSWLWLTARTTEDGLPISSYELWDDVVVYDRVAEAKAACLNERWQVLNIGDDTRFERAYLEGAPWTPKASSKPALRMKLDAFRQRPDDNFHARCIAILEEVL